MPRKGTVNAPKQDYKYIGILYPDSETYCCDAALDAIKSYFGAWAYILHDRDITADGELKKPHIHWYGKKLTVEGKNSYVSISAVSAAIGVPDRDVEFSKSEKASIRYLVHADDEDKYQYPISDIIANISLQKFFRDKCATLKSKMICDRIIETKPRKVMELLPWIFEHDLYAEFRRGFAIWNTIIREVQS